MADVAKCELCGEPMPEGEEMFKFHGYSGPCPRPPLPKPVEEGASRETHRITTQMTVELIELFAAKGPALMNAAAVLLHKMADSPDTAMRAAGHLGFIGMGMVGEGALRINEAGQANVDLSPVIESITAEVQKFAG
jgi:hypothetical protein